MKTMKSLIIGAGLLMISPAIMAQETQEIYCEVIGRNAILSIRGKVKIEVDFGQENKVFEGFDNDVLKDPATGKNMKFNSMIDALNYMSGKGWFFVNAYPVVRGEEMEYHYIMKKTVVKKD